MTKQKALSKKAMLVELSLSVWTGRKKDKHVSEEVMSSKGAEKDAGAWWTYLIPRKAMKNVYSAYGRCRAVHNNLTLPWNDDGCRILPAAMFMDYSKAMREAKDEFSKAVEAFLEEYPALINQAHDRLGKLLDRNALPTPNQLRTKFGVHQRIYPLPDSHDFRVELAEGDVKDIRKQMEADINSSVSKSMTSLWQRLSELVAKIESTLNEPKKIFRDSLFTNLTDFCELIPKLNLTEDAALEGVRKELVERLTKLKPESVRTGKAERKVAHKTAKEMLEKIEGYKNI